MIDTHVDKQKLDKFEEENIVDQTKYKSLIFQYMEKYKISYTSALQIISHEEIGNNYNISSY